MGGVFSRETLEMREVGHMIGIGKARGHSHMQHTDTHSALR